MMRMPERRQRQLRAENRGLILDVENRIDLDEIEADQPARVGDHLHHHVRFAVVEAALDRRADAGRDRRVADVEIERHVDAARVLAGDRERALHDDGDAVPIDVLHREDVRRFESRIRCFSWSSRLRTPMSTVRVGAAPSAIAAADRRELRRLRAEQRRERHAVHVAARRRRRRVHVAVRVDPEQADVARPARRRSPPTRRPIRPRASDRRRARSAARLPRCDW